MARKTQNKTTSKKKTTPKPKVYIAPYKIIILCTAIITLCMGLLLTTTILSKPKKSSPVTDITDTEKHVEKTAPESENLPVREPMPGEEKETPQPVTKQETKPEEKTEIKKENENQEVQKQPETQKSTEQQTHQVAVPEKPQKTSYGFPTAVNNAELVFVFDDGGHSLSQTKAFLDLPFPFTVAVLPKLKFSKESAELVRQSGNEVILHQPMQAINMNVDPGPGAITPDMTENDIISTLFQNITEIGPIAGMNNHEGSAITADAEKMAVILKFASQEGIFFLDSRTNADTSVPYVAGELGYSYYERNIFLDNEKTRENILTELKKGLNIANKKGSVIMIGHIWSAEILPGILKEVYPELKEKGYTFSVVSKSKARK